MARNVALFGLVALLRFALMATADDTPPVGYQPDLKSSEAGLWMMSDKAEKAVQTSPLLVRDPALNGYVRGIVCKLVGAAECPALRFYILEDPTMNAGALPNGAVVVHTGLLLRMQNEAQLAFVLGHEITHYTRRHTLKRFESARDTMNSMAFLGLAGGLLALPIELLAIEGLLAYSRDQEREADAGGFEKATAVGYDPAQAGGIWKMMSVEDKADPHKSGPGIFERNHPTDEDRLAALTKLADGLEESRSDWTIGTDLYRARIAAFRDEWLKDELARGDAWESVVVLERMVSAEPSSGALRYFLGEAYRKRAKDGDQKLAVDAYNQAIACADPPPQAWRDLGLMAMKSGDRQTARADFVNYLAHAPKADDRAMIEFYETQLGAQ